MGDMIESEPKMQNCASATENCMANKCCMTSGAKCWRISDATAKCSKLCPGGNCWVEKPGYAFKPAYMTRDNSIFCYAVYAAKKGTGVTGEKDLAILSAQLKNNVGLFSCNDWEVFSDEAAQLSPTISTRVLPANAEYGKFFRKDKKTHYINTPLFYEAWKLLKADGRWAAMSWTVKVDAPTVFMPDHLRTIFAPKKTLRLVSISRTARRFWRDSSATWRWSALKVSSGSWSRLIDPTRPGAGGKTLRCAKRVGSTALGERTSSCRGPWTMPKSPRLATSP